LAWARDVGSRVTQVENDEFWFARTGLGSRWTGRAAVRAGSQPYALSPAIARNGSNTWLAWQRQNMAPETPSDSRILVTDDPAHASGAHLFATAGTGVVLTAPAGSRRAGVAWQGPTPGSVAVATKRAGRWTEQIVRLGAGQIRTYPLLLTATHGRLTVLAQFHGGDGQVVAAAER
jgi:hypothetical protein